MTPNKPSLRKAPAHLKATTRRWWEEVCADWDLEEHHIRLLTTAAEAWDRLQQARVILDEKGLTYDDRFGAPRSRPEIAVERDSRIAFARIIRELGLDVSVPDAKRPPAIGGRR